MALHSQSMNSSLLIVDIFKYVHGQGGGGGGQDIGPMQNPPSIFVEEVTCPERICVLLSYVLEIFLVIKLRSH